VLRGRSPRGSGPCACYPRTTTTTTAATAATEAAMTARAAATRRATCCSRARRRAARTRCWCWACSGARRTRPRSASAATRTGACAPAGSRPSSSSRMVRWRRAWSVARRTLTRRRRGWQRWTARARYAMPVARYLLLLSRSSTYSRLPLSTCLPLTSLLVVMAQARRACEAAMGLMRVRPLSTY
jgi:hypothetical protein